MFFIVDSAYLKRLQEVQGQFQQELSKGEQADIEVLSTSISNFLLAFSLEGASLDQIQKEERAFEKISQDLTQFEEAHKGMNGLENLCKIVQEAADRSLFYADEKVDIAALREEFCRSISPAIDYFITSMPEAEQAGLTEIAIDLERNGFQEGEMDKILVRYKDFSPEDRKWAWSFIRGFLSPKGVALNVSALSSSLVQIPESERIIRGRWIKEFIKPDTVSHSGHILHQIMNMPLGNLQFLELWIVPRSLDQIENRVERAEAIITYAAGWPLYHDAYASVYTEKSPKGIDFHNFQKCAKLAIQHGVQHFAVTIGLLETYLKRGASEDLLDFACTLLRESTGQKSQLFPDFLNLVQGALLLKVKQVEAFNNGLGNGVYRMLFFENIRLQKRDDHTPVEQRLFAEEALASDWAVPQFIEEVKSYRRKSELFTLYFLSCPRYHQELEAFYLEKNPSEYELASFIEAVTLAVESEVKSFRAACLLIEKFLLQGATYMLCSHVCYIIRRSENVTDFSFNRVRGALKRRLVEVISSFAETNSQEQLQNYLKLVVENAGVLECHQQEPLYHILFENDLDQRGQSNTFKLHRELFEKIREKVDPSIANAQFQDQEMRFSIGGLCSTVKKGERQTYGELPEIQRETLSRVLEGLKIKMEADPEGPLKAAIEGQGDFQALSYNLISSNQRVCQILHRLKGSPEEKAPALMSKLYYIVQKIEMSSDTPEEGQLLSPKEELTLGLAKSTFQCPAGQEEGIVQFYALLQSEEGKAFKGASEEGVEGILHQTLVQAVSQVDQLLSSENAFTKAIIGSEAAFEQLTHQTKYLRNLLAKDLMLTHDFSFDLFGRWVDPTLCSKSREEVLRAFYLEYIGLVIVGVTDFYNGTLENRQDKKGKKAALKLYNNTLEFLSTESPTRVFEFNEEFIPIKVTPYGIEKLLEKLGVLKEIEQT